ncbi:MAG TPA: AraC family transcriptional regulator [Gammaproteobacteria bacterium]|nr:AraC family transcriptional regulator [Gammaproteobacteria bacterium]
MTAGNYSMMGSVAALVAQTLRTYDCDPEPLFRKAGLDMSLLSNPDTRYPGNRVQQLWQLAVDASGDPCFGFIAGEQVQPAVLHGLGFAWLASDTLRDALTRLMRYSRLISTAANMQLQDTDSSLDLVLLPPKGVHTVTPAFQDAGMSGFLRMCRLTAGDEIDPVQVSLKHPRPACARELQAYFRAPIVYEAENNILSFDKQLVDTPLTHANPGLARINDQAVVDYLARFDRDSLTMQVRSRIIERLHDGTPNQQTIAHSLNVSLRSLQRKLSKEETNFKSLLESTRRELALLYIRETHRSLGEITYLLGFSEPSNFTRAFKRWTGISPIEYRDKN